MNYLSKYKKDDFKPVSWEEYDKTLNVLLTKINKYLTNSGTNIDAVVPILRGGAFPGTYLAYRLNLLQIYPVQYKYFFSGKKIILKKVYGLSTGVFETKYPTILLVENNHCFGLTAKTAAKDIKEEYPNSKIIYASDHIDYSFQENEYADEIFYGLLTNETRELSEEECNQEGVKNISYLFPWENIEEEWTTVKGEQFNYHDLEKAGKISSEKVVIEN